MDEELNWRDRTDGRLSSLTTGETVQNDRLDELQDELKTIHEMLEGVPADKDDNGIKGDLVDLSREVNKLRAIMAPDALGYGGLINRIKALEKDDERKARNVEYRWKYWTAVTVAVVSLAGFVLKDWPDLSKRFSAPREDALGKEIEKVKHPKPHHRHYVIHEDEGVTTEDESSE